MEPSLHIPTSPFKRPKNIFWGKFFFVALLSVVFIFGVYRFGYDRGQEVSVGVTSGQVENKTNKKEKIDFSLFWKSWDMLGGKFVDASALDGQKMMYGAIKGMLAASGDVHTNFFTPEEFKSFEEDMGGSFEGIGAEIGRKQGLLTIVAPLDDSPSQRAGIRAGDKVLRIDGENALDMGLDEAVSRMRGPKDTTVTLTVLHKNEEEPKDIVITRGVISVKNVEVKFDNGIATVRISQFGDTASKDFLAAEKEILKQKPKGIILDLRNNPGGLLTAAVDMANELLPASKIILIEEDREKQQKKEYTHLSGALRSIPIVILINEGSASASEILAGALRDNRDDVRLVGMKSFGKGSVQEFIPLPQGTAMKVTVAKWLTPNGTQIDGEGIHPDIEIDLSSDDYNNDRDPQMEKAKEVLRELLAK